MIETKETIANLVDFNTLKDMETHLVPMNEILADPEFNCRGRINPADVIELSRSIDTNGLFQAIVIRPIVLPGTGYKYRIVIGHRRFAAFQILKRTHIPAIIREGLSRLQELTLNFVENIGREDLNILQEAQRIKQLSELGLSIEDIAKIINKGKGWVKIRFLLLNLPPEIQTEAAAGILTQEQIKDISTIPIKSDQFNAVKKIKEARERYEKPVKVRKVKVNPIARKKRDSSEVSRMLEHMLDTIGSFVGTRILAWVNGDISDLDLYRDLTDYSKKHNLKYSPPNEVKKLLLGSNAVTYN